MKWYIGMIAALSLCLWAAADDKAPTLPTSGPAALAINEYSRAAEDADKVQRQALVVANRRLAERLKVALTVATGAGNLDEANAIKAELDAANTRLADLGNNAPVPAATPGGKPVPKPKTTAAVSALTDYAKAHKETDRVHRQTVLAANGRLVEKLKTAVLAATRAGNLDSANAIKAALDAANARIKGAPGDLNAGMDATGDGEIDLLARIKLERDTVSGKWKLDDGRLTAEGVGSRLRIGVKPDVPYAVKLEYRETGTFAFGVFLPVADAQVELVVSNGGMGLSDIDHLNWPVNSAYKKGAFGTDGKKHVIKISVWPSRADARIEVRFEGEQEIDWRGKSSSLSTTALPGPVSLGLQSFGTSGLVVHGLTLRKIDADTAR